MARAIGSSSAGTRFTVRVSPQAMRPGERRFTRFRGKMPRLYSRPILGRFRGESPRRLAVAGWLAAAMVAVSAQALAQAPQYQSDQPDMRAKADSGVAVVCCRNPADYAANKDRFAKYFTQYYFPAMTQYSPKDLEGLGGLRYDLFRLYLWKAQNEDAQRDLTDLTFQEMKKIVVADKPPYHPAVRYNALLVIGMLDGQYAIDAGPNRRSPKPYPEASKLLVAAVNVGIDGKIPPALLVGALVGLERHAQYHESLSPELADAMAAAAVKIIDRDAAIQDVDKDVYAWIQLQAASVLANLGTVGQGGRNLNGLMKLISSDMPLDDRCRVAGLLAKIDFKGVPVDGQAVVGQLMKLAADVTQDEANRARQFQDQSVSGTRSYGESQTFERRRMLTRLVGLSAGLEAVGPVAPEAAKAYLASVVSAVNQITTTAENNDTVDLDLTEKVIEMAGTVQAAVNAAAAGGPGGAAKTSS